VLSRVVPLLVIALVLQMVMLAENCDGTMVLVLQMANFGSQQFISATKLIQ